VDLDKAPCLTADRKNRIPVGQQLRADKNVYPSAVARKTLLVGQVDPRLLVTLSALAHEMPLELVAFDDSSRTRSDVPLHAAEIGAAAAAGCRP
jgi:hypothetical protein